MFVSCVSIYLFGVSCNSKKLSLKAFNLVSLMLTLYSIILGWEAANHKFMALELIINFVIWSVNICRSSDDGTCRIWDARYSHYSPRIYLPKPSEAATGWRTAS